jgi:K+-transporting ATPase KdpF subunit
MRGPPRRFKRYSPMENLLIAFIALALLVYLVVAVLRPEKF